MDLAVTKSLILLNKEKMAKPDKKNTIKMVSYVLKKIEKNIHLKCHVLLQ